MVVSVISIWTTGFIINSYVQNLVKQYNLPIEVPPIALSGVWKSLWGSSSGGGSKEIGNPTAEGPITATGNSTDTDGQTPFSSGKPSTGDTKQGMNDSSPGSSRDADEPGQTRSGNTGSAGAIGDANTGAGKGPTAEDTGASGASGAAGEDDEENTPPLSVEIGGGTGPKANSGAVSGGAAGAGGMPGNGDPGSDPLVMSPDQLTSTKEQLSSEDRQQLFTLLIDKLPQEAWQKISTYMEDGLTESELQDIQQIVAQYLNDEEYQALMKILKKY